MLTGNCVSLHAGFGLNQLWLVDDVQHGALHHAFAASYFLYARRKMADPLLLLAEVKLQAAPQATQLVLRHRSSTYFQAAAWQTQL